MLPTPDTSHVSFDHVYEPAEDSFLLLDTLSNQAETSWLRQHFNQTLPFVVEVGTGSGVVLSFLAANAEHIFGTPILTLGIDVNMESCRATKQTVVQAVVDQGSRSTYTSSICADLCTPLRTTSVDVLVFNPPYVPSEEVPILPHLRHVTDAFEHSSHLLSLTYAGGRDGTETTNRLLSALPQILSNHGVMYLLLCAQNKPEDVKKVIQSLPEGPWQVQTVGSSGKKAGWERLQIVRAWR